MKEIALVVENFIKKYQELNDFDSFVEEFAAIKDVLVKRIKFEEEILYELYDGCYNPKIVVEKLQNSALKQIENYRKPHTKSGGHFNIFTIEANKKDSSTFLLFPL